MNKVLFTSNLIKMIHLKKSLSKN